MLAKVGAEAARGGANPPAHHGEGPSCFQLWKSDRSTGVNQSPGTPAGCLVNGGFETVYDAITLTTEPSRRKKGNESTKTWGGSISESQSK